MKEKTLQEKADAYEKMILTREKSQLRQRAIKEIVLKKAKVAKIKATEEEISQWIRDYKKRNNL